MTVAQAIDRYLAALRDKDVSPLTIRNYHHWLQRLADHVGDSDITRLDRELIERYRQHLLLVRDAQRGASLKLVTVNYHLIALRSLLKYFQTQGHSVPEWKKVPLIAHRYFQPRALQKEELEQLLRAPSQTTKKGLRDRAILELLSDTGMLVSELTTLNRSDFSAKEKKISVVTKRGGTRSVSVSDRCVYWLSQYLATRQDPYIPLFIRYQGLIDLTQEGEYMRLTPRSIERIVGFYGKVAQIPDPVTPHMLRHTRASVLLQEGSSVESVQVALDHAHVQTTKFLYGRKK